MYPPPELLAQEGRFGAADLVQQRGTVAELVQICQAWGSALASLHCTAMGGSVAPVAARPWVVNPQHLTVSIRSADRGLGHAAAAGSGRLRLAARAILHSVQNIEKSHTQLLR